VWFFNSAGDWSALTGSLSSQGLPWGFNGGRFSGGGFGSGHFFCDVKKLNLYYSLIEIFVYIVENPPRSKDLFSNFPG
jgi:hypothetical protein